jgi:uncharacterized protein (TIGR02118 family)
MGYSQIVAYPRKDGATFDEAYYNTSHMPFVEKSWKSFGLKWWKVIKYSPEAPYSYAAITEWDSHESFQKAMQTEATKEIMADITNYSSETPVILVGDVIAQSSY